MNVQLDISSCGGDRPIDVLTNFLSVAEGWLWTWQRTAASVIFTHFLYNKENQNVCSSLVLLRTVASYFFRRHCSEGQLVG